ncbi:hypothetical protein G6F56_009377 [Rhizopus delemar]|nr:hypothetical protein G6F56_009377 [Rhizopus delemar]
MDDRFKLPPISTLDRPTHYLSTPNEDKTDKDVQSVILQCNTICDTMIQGKNQFLQDSHRLDDMVQRANEILNALLRLRKHQIATEQTEVPDSPKRKRNVRGKDA